MISALEIQGLRGIREAKLEGLAPLTILVGPNGCGKSTVLEAAGVACAGGDSEKAFRALASREWLGLVGMAKWFADPAKGAIITAKFTPPPVASGDPIVAVQTVIQTGAPEEDQLRDARRAGDRGELRAFGAFARIVRASAPEGSPGETANRLTLVNEDGFLGWSEGYDRGSLLPFASRGGAVDRPAGAATRFGAPRFSSHLRDALTAIKLTPWYDDLFGYLQLIRPSLSSIESLAVGDRDEPFMFEGQPRVGYPLAFAGDGFRRSLLIAATLAEAKGGVAALDEPEAYAHPRMHDALARLIRRALDDGTQVMIATHSLEFVRAALAEFEKDPERACVVALRRDKDVLDPLVIDGPDAYRRVVELADDLRL